MILVAAIADDRLVIYITKNTVDYHEYETQHEIARQLMINEEYVSILSETIIPEIKNVTLNKVYRAVEFARKGHLRIIK